MSEEVESTNTEEKAPILCSETGVESESPVDTTAVPNVESAITNTICEDTKQENLITTNQINTGLVLKETMRPPDLLQDHLNVAGDSIELDEEARTQQIEVTAAQQPKEIQSTGHVTTFEEPALEDAEMLDLEAVAATENIGDAHNKELENKDSNAELNTSAMDDSDILASTAAASEIKDADIMEIDSVPTVTEDTEISEAICSKETNLEVPTDIKLTAVDNSDITKLRNEDVQMDDIQMDELKSDETNIEASKAGATKKIENTLDEQVIDVPQIDEEMTDEQNKIEPIIIEQKEHEMMTDVEKINEALMNEENNDETSINMAEADEANINEENIIELKTTDETIIDEAKTTEVKLLGDEQKIDKTNSTKSNVDESNIDVPNIDEPNIDESNIDESNIDEPNIDALIIDESIIVESKIDEVNIEQEKIKNSYESKSDEIDLNVTKKDESKIDDKKIDESKIDEAKIDEAKIDESKIDDKKIDESKIDEAKIDESKIDESKIDESKIDESDIDKRNIDRPKTDEAHNVHSKTIGETVVSDETVLIDETLPIEEPLLIDESIDNAQKPAEQTNTETALNIDEKKNVEPIIDDKQCDELTIVEEKINEESLNISNIEEARTSKEPANESIIEVAKTNVSVDDDVVITEEINAVIEIDDDDDDDVVQQVVEEIKEKESIQSADKNTVLETEKTSESKESMEVDVVVAKTDTNEATATAVTASVVADVEMKEATVEENKNNEVDKNIANSANELLEETVSKTVTPTATTEQMNIDEDDVCGDVYYNKECVNYECPRKHKQYFRAPLFALSYFKLAKKKFKPQFICATCYDQALELYEEFTSLLAAKQPLLLKDVVGGRQEFVEIIDSSDEEDTEHNDAKINANNCFSADNLKLIEAELEHSIRKVLNDVEIQQQLTWSKTILQSRARALEAETSYIDEQLRSLQKKADNMHVELYTCPKIKVRQLQPLDLNTGRPYTTLDAEVWLPPIGEIQRPPIQINETYYAVKNKAIASWVPCKVIEQVDGLMVAQKHVKQYKIKFLKSQYQMIKLLSVKHLAFFDPPSVRLPIGTRVIAYFDATSLSRGKPAKMMIQSAFYPGIIAEPLKPNNKYRYLIFYDDGYTQYVYHKDVRLVCNVSENVWEDVHPGSRDFIQKYLTQYSINRPMVQTQKGQSMTTESNGKWIYARVVDIDCSLIQMQFEGPKSHTEWIYRGSMRLGPVFKEHQKTIQKNALPISRLPRRTEPFIRYTEDEEASSTQQQAQQQQQQQQHQQHQQQQQLQQRERLQQQQQQQEPRAVAKKSVSRQDSTSSATQSSTATQALPTVRHLNNSTIYLEDENKPKGKVVYYTAKRNMPPLSFKPHTCVPTCLFKITHNLSAYSPLSKPLLSGWERIILRQKVKKFVTYRAPCGKILRNMKELRVYLRITENQLNVDNFDFSPETNCLAEYVIESAIVQKRDISGGQEKMAIPLVNYYDNTMPPECKYAAERIPTKGVHLNTDVEFMAGCDCEDDCSDKTKCSCWQLTYAGAKYGNPNTPIDEIGYQYKRLYEHVPTGIYECNPRCKCKSRCLNRVVQHSLEMKLQVFKTSNRGWGLRCINDVPRGSFICVYAGNLLTEAQANEGGLDAGDEYFAELDYIEVAEQIKEGYESDVEPPEQDEDDEAYDQEDDDEFTPSKPVNTRSKNKPQRTTRNQQSAQGTEDDSQERQMINFNPNAVMDENSMRESSIRQLFGKDEACYIMDAKVTGNLGRYFNHSCSPNLFVQNVFVDTHDLRFPWVAFFALTHIRAGTELTWNYNYEVGVVPGKVLYCQCGAPNCRLRLL